MNKVLRNAMASVAFLAVAGGGLTACAQEHDHDVEYVYVYGYYDSHHHYHKYSKPKPVKVSVYKKNQSKYGKHVSKPYKVPSTSRGTVNKVKPKSNGKSVWKTPKSSSKGFGTKRR